MLRRDLLLFIGTALVSTGLTAWVRRLVIAKGWAISQPRPRDVHTKPVPRLGGIALTLSFVAVSLLVAGFSPETLHFVGGKIGGIDRNLFGILLAVVLLVVVGAIDDVRGLAPWAKLVFHFAAGAILASSGVLIEHITNPFGGDIYLGAWAYSFVVLWVVVMINAINWLDGLDGLASGVSLIAVVILYLLAIRPDVNQLSMSVLAVVLGGALVGFLPWNFFPARIFLGDSGSQVLGFLLATFAIISGGKVATAFLILGVPLMDTLWVILRRLLAHQPPYKADRLHIHHRLVSAGLSQRQAVALLYALAAGFGVVALNTRSLGKLYASLSLIAIMIVGGAFLVLLPKLRLRGTDAQKK